MRPIGVERAGQRGVRQRVGQRVLERPSLMRLLPTSTATSGNDLSMDMALVAGAQLGEGDRSRSSNARTSDRSK